MILSKEFLSLPEKLRMMAWRKGIEQHVIVVPKGAMKLRILCQLLIVGSKAGLCTGSGWL